MVSFNLRMAYKNKYLGDSLMELILKSVLMSLSLLSVSSLSLAADKALIIGVGEYEDPMNNLTGIDLDSGMIDEMAQRLGIDESNITHLSDSQATRKNILKELDSLANTTTSQDRVLIYYSGHGSQVEDTNGDEPDNMDETLYVYDGHLIDDDINEALSKIKSNNMVVLIDACHSGTGTKSLAANMFSQNRQRVQVKSIGYDKRYTDSNLALMPSSKAKPKNSMQQYISIGAAQDDEQSLATPEGSIFTKAIYESFEEARRDGSSSSWQALYDSTAYKISSLSLDASERFSPKIDGDTSLLNKPIYFANNTDTIEVNKQRVIDLVGQLPKDVVINSPSMLNVGEEFVVELTTPVSGYLNAVTVGADDSVTVLFPNKYATNNKIQAQTISLPGNGKFKIVATEPRGETLVAAFITQKPIDLTSKGFGFLDAQGKVKDEAFAKISGASIDQALTRRNLAIVPIEGSTTPIAIANYAIVNIK
ncbi:caspase family protein [Psychrobacter proteolyticus]|uniref:Caspase family protein n=1 Tax=Psychrobacter proteolyticus TaxID=147825 RepID=A0ABV0D5Z6_9GAMM